MIGDWVLISVWDCKPFPSKVTSINYNSYQGKDFVDWIDTEDEEEIGMYAVQPIPLTPEILEKNNDILYGELPILFDDGKMHYSIIECRYVSKEYERNDETFYCLLSGCAYHGGSFVTPFAKIRYVHELQHALKLCGIEKEIVL